MIDVFFLKNDPIYGEVGLELYKMVKITSIEGLDGNEVQIDTQHIPYVNGEYITNKSINGRDIIINMAIENNKRSQYEYYEHVDKTSEISAFFSNGSDFKMCASIPIDSYSVSSSLNVPIEFKDFTYSRFDQCIKAQLKVYCPEGGLRSGHHVQVTTQPRPPYVDIGGYATQKIYIGKDYNSRYVVPVGADCPTWPRIEFKLNSGDSNSPTFFVFHDYWSRLQFSIKLNSVTPNEMHLIQALTVETDPRKRSIMAYDPFLHGDEWVDWTSQLEVIDARFMPFKQSEANLQMGVMYYDKYDYYKEKWYTGDKYDVDIHFDNIYVGV